jgi:helicase
MLITEIKQELPEKIYKILEKEIKEFRPCQEKAIKQGLLKGKNQLICTPTASGKTLVGELAITNNIQKGKALYIVPLKALANEKFKDFKKKYDHLFNIALSIGDLDSADPYLDKYSLIFCTAEKLDSLIRHNAPWLSQIKTVVIDEIHLMNDMSRGPTLEILITILKKILPNMQLIGLSATIGNPKELAQWLEAELIIDNWRPVKLEKGTYFNGEIEFE